MPIAFYHISAFERLCIYLDQNNPPQQMLTLHKSPSGHLESHQFLSIHPLHLISLVVNIFDFDIINQFSRVLCDSISRRSVRPSVGMNVMLLLFSLLGATYAVYSVLFLYYNNWL